MPSSEVLQWRFQDRTGWPSGPWDGEPDKVSWIDTATGLECMAHRGPITGVWCGYVGIPVGHPWYDVEYEDIPVDVHGGLSYSSRCAKLLEDGSGIASVLAPVDDGPLWWIGFDCGHWGDLSPGLARGPLAFKSKYEPTYRTLEWVVKEVERLKDQVWARWTASLVFAPAPEQSTTDRLDGWDDNQPRRFTL